MKDESPIRIAIYGGSFNPPGLHHLQVARILASQFPWVSLIPCGFRKDKVHRDSDWMEADLRRKLMVAAFKPVMTAQIPGAGRIEFDFRDLDNDSFTTTFALAEIYRDLGDPWFVVGADLLNRGASGDSPIQRTWYQGPWIWEHLNWICLTRPGFRLLAADLPPHHIQVEMAINGSSSLIRDCLRQGISISGLVSTEVEQLLRSNRAFL